MSTLELDRPAPGRHRATAPVNRPPVSRRVGGIVRGVAIAVVLVVLLFPLLWMLLASFKTSLEVVDPSRVLNFTPTLDNYRNVVAQGDFLRFIGNSFLVAAAATLVSLVVGVPAAYAIARYRVAHATTFLLMARIIPGVSLLVPWYFLFAQIQLVGTYAVLVLTHVFVAMPLVVAIMASFVEGLPAELEEAGQVDGLTRIGAFLRVTLPLSTPGIATAAILSFIFSWNNFLFALVLSDQNTRTLPVAIANFTAYASVDWGGLMAASVLITVPVMAIALLAQRYVVSGLTAGATKG
jgi:multiple sugar transport system permease protein